VDAFAKFFQSIYSDPAAVYTKFDSISNHNNICLCSVSADEVFQSIKRIKSNYVQGPDGIPAFFVKDCASVLSQPMSVLFNLCIKTGTFPEIWKISKILPTHKSKDRSVIENYRPISIINNFAKIFESLIFDQLYFALSKLISPSQHGFMRGRSTTTNLFCATQLISDSVDKGFQTDVVYLDFSKAFGSLDHNILIQKLQFVGASPMLVKFFCSYLQGRKQYVHCYGYDSGSIDVTSGVPQGSVLGPLLFLVFINDIGDKLTVPFFLFADDAKLLKQISEWSDCVTLQANLDEIMNWCTRNKLSLNINKCQVMSFSLKKENIRFDYTLSLNLLNRPETVKDLGVIFDRKLSFTRHIDHVVSDSMKQLGFLIRNSRDFQSSRTLTMLFNAFVRSKLHYACIIWQPHHNIQAAKLEQIIRKFLKYLYLRDVGEYPPIGIAQTYLLNRFDCVSFATSCKKALAMFAFKLMHNILDCSEILSQLAFNAGSRGTKSRHYRLFYLPAHRTDIDKFSPLCNMCRLANDLHCQLDLFSCTLNCVKSRNFSSI
jgi:hypothetical protein